MAETTARRASASPRRTVLIGLGAAAVVLLAMALDTKVVHIGSDSDLRQQAFSPDSFGTAEFPRIQGIVREKAVDALTLGPAVLADKAAAGQQYGTPSSTGVILMTKLSGEAGEAKAGTYTLSVPGLPPDITVRLQTGPAINGTDLRDAPGDIAFGQFKNQIEYQNAAAAINRAMKKAVLDPLDLANLSGKTVEVTGAFRLVNPKNWLITPVALVIK